MDNYREIISKSPEETAQLGSKTADLVRNGVLPRLVCLYGELGSGKTTFVRGFVHSLGFIGRLLSPTFIIVRHYTLPKNFGDVYHADLYRINSKAEIQTLGLHEIFENTDAFVLIEWSERLGGLLPQKRLDVTFKVQDDETHLITLQH